MKAHEVIKLADMLNSFRPKEDKPVRRPRPDKRPYIERMSDLDLANLMQRRLAEADAVRKMLEDREKANKKEEKKDDKKITTPQLAMLLLLSYPIIGLVILVAMRKI